MEFGNVEQLEHLVERLERAVQALERSTGIGAQDTQGASEPSASTSGSLGAKMQPADIRGKAIQGFEIDIDVDGVEVVDAYVTRGDERIEIFVELRNSGSRSLTLDIEAHLRGADGRVYARDSAYLSDFKAGKKRTVSMVLFDAAMPATTDLTITEE